MKSSRPSTADLCNAIRRRTAYRQANRLIVSAGGLLASWGVPADAPEIRAIGFALQMVNKAGGIGKPEPEDSQSQNSQMEIRYEPLPRRVRPGPGRDESVA
jgi:hypothetical protein